MPDKTTRLPDPASAPCSHAWVSANAGAGKTSLLVKRVLRLLLAGVRPCSILCLTYTKAAAAEMRERIDKQLGLWAVANPQELEKALLQLNGEAPNRPMLDRARTLLAEVLDEPEGLRIQTIHAFCQSLLQRFPLEANMPPHFSVMDERTSEELLREAAIRLLMTEKHQRIDQIKAAIGALASRFSDQGFAGVLEMIRTHKRRFYKIFLDKTPGIDFHKESLARQFGLELTTRLGDIIAQHCRYGAKRLALLRQAVQRLHRAKNNEQAELSHCLNLWLEAAGNTQREALWPDYRDSLLTDKKDKRKWRGIDKILPEELLAALREEQDHVLACHETVEALATMRSSAHLLELAYALLGLYESLKAQQGLLDYDDLVTFSTRLLTGNNNEYASWVLYKLDGGIDHILVDEAQDTSLEQWQIVRALTDEFFAGEGRSQQFRSLFVVGDEKQSIYRFQNAEPRAFIAMHDYYKKRAADAGQRFVSQAMQISWRSADAILKAVDTVFNTPSMRAAVMAFHAQIRHDPARSGMAGRVELWPLQPSIEKPRKEAWELPLEPRYRSQASQILAEQIAQTIATWVQERRTLPSVGRAVQPDDILILVQRRNPMMQPLVRALKRLHIPVVSASDDPLPQNLAAMDMLALARFLLLPEDNLNLAALLKSPLYGFGEDELLHLSQREKEQSLWHSLQQAAGEGRVFSAAHAELSALLGKADFMPPYELFSHVLDALGGATRMIARMGHEYRDALQDFMTETLAFEQTHTPTLQGFVHWLERSNSKRKKQTGASGGYVRVMTVHGAKGLEAPIVFLADSNSVKSSAGNRQELQWIEAEDGRELPVWSRSASGNDPLSRSLHTRRKEEDEAEYIRLLYVAMTRARDELYICGIEKAKNESGVSWHQHLGAALENIAQPCETPLGQGICLTCPQTAEPKTDNKIALLPDQAELPAWLQSSAPQEPRPSKPLSPSRLAEPEDETPHQPPARGSTVFRRGLLIHRLLQYLPSLPALRRGEAAELFMQHQAAMFSEAERAAMIRESLAVIESPDYAPFFAEGSLAEVPLSGVIELGGQPYTVAGQVDRLCIGTKDIWVLDFKTNRVLPASLQQIPSSYLRQMACYRELLQRIYPLHHIHCALLWTSVPELSILPADLLDRRMQHLDAA